MPDIPIGLQLYSVREDCTRDLPDVLSQVARMGYAGVEFAGYYGYAASDLRAMLDSHGLACYGTHTALDTLLGDALPRTIEFNQALGNPYLIVPSLPAGRTHSQEAWQETARLFNEASERAGAAGMKVGYHNHTEEFQPLEGVLPWDTFFGDTRPEVIMQVDTGNMMTGGADPVPFLERYPGRALTVHLKEFSPDNPNALIGEGDVPWAEVFRLCETIGGTQWYIVEQETHAGPPLESVRICLQNLRGMGK